MISVRAGDLEGAELAGVVEYLGIPYAQPPTGPLRFRPPEPVSPWAGTLRATTYGTAAPQHVLPSPPGIPGMVVGRTSEDCLYLNVWAPAAASASLRPVMVWIHGGGLFGGSSSEPVYRGARLAAAADAVVISVNYRLGVLGGFIRVSDLGDARLADSHDLGLLDLILALGWVRDNVEAFGGDPERVTIFGQSAGGHLVGALLASPLSRGTFHRAILQSPQRLYFHNDAQAGLVAESFERAFGGSLSRELYGAETDRILVAQDIVLGQLLHSEVGVPFMCGLDARILPRQLMDVAAAGDIADVPILVGTTVDETQMLFPRAANPIEERQQFDACVSAMLPQAAEGTRRALWDGYAAAASNPDAPTPPNPSAWFAADYMLRIPADRLLVAQSTHQPDTYSYLFNVRSRIGHGAFHSIEVPFVFGTIDQSEWAEHIEPSQGGGLTELLQRAWSSFAREGKPSAPQLGDWPPFAAGDRNTMVIELHSHIASNPWAARMPAWDAVP